MNAMKITDEYFVAAQIDVDEVSAIAAHGFVAVICNRPDGEDSGQPTAAAIATACIDAGIAFHHVPITTLPIPSDAIREHQRVIEESNGPVLGYCRSGQRSAVIFAACD